MDHDDYRYLIVGGGMAADATVRGIREVDAGGSIGLLSSEADPPYKRPPLSKKLWHGKPLDSVWLGTDQLGVDLHLGRTGRLLDLQHKRVVDDRGTEYGFDKLLLATGVTPRRLPFGGHGITYYRTLKDYQRLRQEAAIRRDRRRVHRLGDRGGPGHEREGGRDDPARGRHRQSPLSL
jgi:3-phenylpropionate/trans-cinnamate dioxygenase ferredoxin reductase subunit